MQSVTVEHTWETPARSLGDTRGNLHWHCKVFCFMFAAISQDPNRGEHRWWGWKQKLQFSTTLSGRKEHQLHTNNSRPPPHFFFKLQNTTGTLATASAQSRLTEYCRMLWRCPLGEGAIKVFWYTRLLRNLRGMIFNTVRDADSPLRIQMPSLSVLI